MSHHSFRRLAATVVLVLGGLGAASCMDQELETRTFRLQSLRSDEAQELIRPYVYEDREGAPGAMSEAANALTVRELPENLDRIQAVLEEFDRSQAPLRLRFHLIYADGDTVTDPEIAEITDALRGVLRFDGYRLAGSSVMQVHGVGVRSHPSQRLGGPDGVTYDLGVAILDVWGPPDSLTVHLGVELSDPWDDLLRTEVSAPVGETIVIGTGQARGGQAVILAVTPELAPAG